MKRSRMVAAGVLLAACQATDGPRYEREREGHPANLAADEQAADRLREVEPMKARRWVFEGPGGECRMIGGYTFTLDRSGGNSSKGKRLPLSSMFFNLEGEPCPNGVRLPWRWGRAEREAER